MIYVLQISITGQYTQTTLSLRRRKGKNKAQITVNLNVYTKMRKVQQITIHLQEHL